MKSYGVNIQIKPVWYCLVLFFVTILFFSKIFHLSFGTLGRLMVNNNMIILNIIIVHFQKISIQSQTSTRKVTLEILRGGGRGEGGLLKAKACWLPVTGISRGVGDPNQKASSAW